MHDSLRQPSHRLPALGCICADSCIFSLGKDPLSSSSPCLCFLVSGWFCLLAMSDLWTSGLLSVHYASWIMLVLFLLLQESFRPNTTVLSLSSSYFICFFTTFFILAQGRHQETKAMQFCRKHLNSAVFWFDCSWLGSRELSRQNGVRK